MTDERLSQELKLLIVDRLDRIERDQRDLLVELRRMKETDLPRLRQDLALVRLRASLWGGFMGAMPAFIAAVVWFLTR